MADVTIAVGGHNYTVNCADGEEAELERLAAIVNVETDNVRAAIGSLSESRQLLFAALFLADKVSEKSEEGEAAASPEILQAIGEATRKVSEISTRLQAIAAAPLES